MGLFYCLIVNLDIFCWNNLYQSKENKNMLERRIVSFAIVVCEQVNCASHLRIVGKVLG